MSLTLNWEHRPTAVQEGVQRSFQAIAKESEPSINWGFTGDKRVRSGYHIGDVNEHALIQHILTTAETARTHFYLLDIGSGAAHWAMGMADFINQHTLNKTLHVTIISLTGEQAREGIKPVNPIGQCTLMTFYAFKIEELVSEFKKRGLFSELENNVDFAISRCTFMHFTDSYASFEQACRLVKPKTGYFLLDGLHAQFPSGDTFYRIQMQAQLFRDMHLHFVDLSDGINHGFIIQRADDKRYPIFFRYTGAVSKALIKREAFEAELERTGPITVSFDTLYGDSPLYHSLKDLGIITNPRLEASFPKKDPSAPSFFSRIFSFFIPQ